MSSIDNFDSLFSSRTSDGGSKLQRLRYHLAIEGCSDSQLSLAKSFLHDAAETEAEKKENAELAVRWLLLASSEGNQEAFQLLESCYKMGVGVTYGNREQIESCLRSTIQEKLAQRVGCNLFRLIAYDTQESVPLEYFQERISLYLKDEDITEHHNQSLDAKIYCSTTYVTAQDVVASVQDCLLGDCPAIRIEDEPFDLLAVSDCNFNLSYVKYMLSHAIRKSALTCDVFCLKAAKSYLCLILLSYIILIITASSFIPSLYFVQYREAFMQIFECVLAFQFLIIVIVTSSRLVLYEKNLVNIQKWTKIISKCNSKTSQSIPKYRKFNFASNLFAFLLGTVLFMSNNEQMNSLALFGLCAVISLLRVKYSVSEMHIVSCMFLSLSFILSLTRVTPDYTEKELEISTIPVTHQKLIVKPLAILSILSFATFLIMLCQNRFRSCLNFLVSTIWFNIITENIYQIEKFTILFLFFFAIPAIKKLGFHGAVIFVYFISQLITKSDYIVAFFVCAICLLSLTFAKIIIFLKRACSISWYHIYPPLLLVVLILGAHQLPSGSVSYFGTRSNITWGNYAKLCHRPAWADSNMVHTQISCDKFQYQTLFFEANVNNVVRKSSHRFTFPNFLNLQLIDLNANSYEVMLEIKGTFRVEATISLLTDDRCKDFVLDLSAGDLLSVTGTFQSGLGTDKLVLTLEEAQCISCMDDVKCHIKTTDWQPFRISHVAKVVKFLLYPWIK